MKIVFMGTPDFAVPSLRAVVEAKHDVLAVVTNQDEPQGRGLKVLPSAVKTAALELSLPIIEIFSPKNPEFIARLKELSPDVMVVVAFRILPPNVFSIPRVGTFNLHASLLPKYRGAAPINWAIINGEKETGVTTFFIDDKVDTGKVILQKKTQIGEDETAGELAKRLSQLGAEAVIETLAQIQNASVNVMEQDNSLSTKAPKILKEDCLIDWSKPAGVVHNFIRGFSPDPGGYTFLGNKMLKIFRTRALHGSGVFPAGIVKVDGGRFFVACGDNFLEILELQLEGKKKLASADFLRGAKVEPGTQLKKSRV